MTCTCKDWEPNIKIINEYIMMNALHSYGNPKGYSGKVIKYCPWCGKKLRKEKKA